MTAPRIFVSHSSTDGAFAVRLVGDLRRAGADAWIYEGDDTAGNIIARIDELLARCDWLVLVLSPEAITSRYVQTEVYVALNRVHQGHMKGVIPITARAFAPNALTPLWAVLRRFDATGDYQLGVAGLLRALGLPPPDSAEPVTRSAPPPTAPTSLPVSAPGIAQPIARIAPLARPSNAEAEGELPARERGISWTGDLPPRYRAACKSDIGKQRDQNEDACYMFVQASDQPAAGMFIVADGMGGYHAGEVASKIAVESISETLRPLLGPTSAQPSVRLRGRKSRLYRSQSGANDDPNNLQPLAAKEQSVSEPAATERVHNAGILQLNESVVLEHYAGRLRAAVERSSEEIVAYGQQHSEARGLGSTVTAALAIGDQVFIANVGDSRTYLFRDGKLEHVTQDHSLVERLVEAGQIDREDVYTHPNRNLIYRSLGPGHVEVEVDIFTERMRAGDGLLLCSDGLWHKVRDHEIAQVLANVNDPAEACDRLVELANDYGGEDNITVILVRYV